MGNTLFVLLLHEVNEKAVTCAAHIEWRRNACRASFLSFGSSYSALTKVSVVVLPMNSHVSWMLVNLSNRGN